MKINSDMENSGLSQQILIHVYKMVVTIGNKHEV